MKGKHLAIAVLDLNKDRQVVGGSIKAGQYEDGVLVTPSGRDKLGEFEGKEVFVTIRHELLGPVDVNAFDHKFQLGAKMGDLDT
jgi:hypothetical protein